MSEFEGVVVRNKDSKISFGVSEWKWARLKNPVLYVQVEGHCYKVASFNNREKELAYRLGMVISEFWCGACQFNLIGRPKFCPNCGKKVRWND